MPFSKSLALTLTMPSVSICGAVTFAMQSAPTKPRPAHACHVMAGYEGVTTAANSFAMLSLTESPT